jgi:pantoate--beta-alanine ligase
MHVFTTIQEMHTWVKTQKMAQKTIGFVPTMGALHQGHLALTDHASKHCDHTVVSIFVNPTQFGPNEDFHRYPRNTAQDLALCENQQVSAVFLPDVKVLYPDKSYITFTIHTLNAYLCGPSRPGHFEGVVQIVNKLFNIVQPDFAILGQKDYQQFKIIEHFTISSNQSVQLLLCPTVRESDGLALSSRNAYLSEAERKRAPMIYACLLELRDLIRSGASISASKQQIISKLEHNGFKVDYVDIVSERNLQPINEFNDTLVLAIAAYLGKTRLIDNLLIEP